jgi:hypothetical protein
MYTLEHHKVHHNNHPIHTLENTKLQRVSPSQHADSQQRNHLRSLTTKTTSELDVLGLCKQLVT